DPNLVLKACSCAAIISASVVSLRPLPPSVNHSEWVPSFNRNFWAGTALGWTYHYSRTTMNWTQARKWCQTHYTDMVVIQNQEENDYLVSKLPNKNKSPYYWIGITKNHKSETWTWIGNNSTWIGEQSWAANEPNNNHSTEFCVEIYVNRRENRGKWNDEKCANGKYPVCYQGMYLKLFM
uniref:C-type lectin domain-containing protein n=1 Tax=Mola mola TaxID=94237 RepID=A0A3Q3XPV4_MOLML